MDISKSFGNLEFDSVVSRETPNPAFPAHTLCRFAAPRSAERRSVMPLDGAHNYASPSGSVS